MPLANIQIAPGFNKQVTETGAEGQWTDGDFVRFRYGSPEKIGGWEQITSDTLVGAVREQLVWADLDGRRYAALGTNKVLLIYYESAFYDITPLDTAITGCTFDTTNTSATVTVNKTTHGLVAGDLFTFTSVTPPSGAGYVAADFTTNTFQVVTAAVNSFTITMASAASGASSASGAATVNPYIKPGPVSATAGYGWGTGTWGRGTWGSASTASNLIIDPASWSIDNFGQVMIATVKNGKTFSWNPINADSNALDTRAVVVTGAPTRSIMSIVSDRDRHLVLLGTETTVGSGTTQDKMFIRFSDQENLSEYTPTSVNTAGTFRLDSGVKIVGAAKGKDYILILTDTSAYVMQFVGPPFTFSIRQVGSNCGLIGQHALHYVNGRVWWMGQAGGFFVFDGTVKSVPCLVEDFVFTNTGSNLGINYSAGEQVYAGLNHLYEEINWFYPKSGSEQVDRLVTYNYTENAWTTGSLSRTSFHDATLFDNPYATEFAETAVPTFPTIQGVTNINGASTYYAHEVGVDQVDSVGNKTAIPAFIQSGDFDLSVGGDGEFFMSMRRFIPDFKRLVGNAQITINLRNYPTSTAASSPLGPFTITSSTDKVDTRARSRFASVKVANLSTDQSWRYGTFRADVQPDGMRG
tara:strand:- start:3704 stop:5614 length:1911 start_codon:yes stop_codon:yes gene_type:complete